MQYFCQYLSIGHHGGACCAGCARASYLTRPQLSQGVGPQRHPTVWDRVCSPKTLPGLPGSQCRKVQGQHESASTSRVSDRWLTARIRTRGNRPRSCLRWRASHRRRGHWATRHHATRACCAMSLTAPRREELRAFVQSRLPIAPDGTIHLMTRAWAVQGIAVEPALAPDGADVCEEGCGCAPADGAATYKRPPRGPLGRPRVKLRTLDGAGNLRAQRYGLRQDS